MSKSQSKELFKKKARGRAKKTTSLATSTNSNVTINKTYHIQASHGNAVGLLNAGEDPAAVVIHSHSSTTTTPAVHHHQHHVKEKRTKMCCLL
jgi:hypothetical protein